MGTYLRECCYGDEATTGRLQDFLNSLKKNNIEDRDGMLKSGMEKGAIETTDRFAEEMEKMRRQSI